MDWGEALPLVFLLLVALATGMLAAHAGREEVRVSAEPVWRMESFAAYSIFLGLILLPTTLYFYVFYADWFLFYWADTRQAPWLWGIVSALLTCAAGLLGFRTGTFLSRRGRCKAPRRIAGALLLLAVLVWPLGWDRISRVGSHRQFTHGYGLSEYLSSATFYSGALILLVASTAFAWVFLRIGHRTSEPV